MDATPTRIVGNSPEIQLVLNQFRSLDPGAADPIEAPTIGPIAAEGDVLNISGPAGCGKTSLLSDILIACAHPERQRLALGGLLKVSGAYQDAGKVAIIDGENTLCRWQSILRRKLDAEGLDADVIAARCSYATPASIGLHDPRNWQDRSVQLADALAAQGVNFVFIDSLARIWAPVDINHTDWVQLGFTPFRDACKRLGITVVAVSHTRRNSGRNNAELAGPMGSSMQEGQVDCQIIMTKDKDGRGCSLRLVKCRRAFWIRSGSSIAFKFTHQLGYVPQGNWAAVWPHEPPDESQSLEGLITTRVQIVSLLACSDTTPIATAALASQLGLETRTVRGHLHALETEGKVKRLGRGPCTKWRSLP